MADLIKMAVILSLFAALATLKSCGDHNNQIKQPTKNVNTTNSTLKTRTFLVQQSQKEQE